MPFRAKPGWTPRGMIAVIATLAALATTLAGGTAHALPSGTSASSSPAPASAQPNNDAHFIQVYVNNIENLETVNAKHCPGDWQDLVHYMKADEVSPDLFIVQQLSGPKELKTLLKLMNEQLPGKYDGKLAVQDPEWMESPDCKKEKDHQTNAIIWQVDRFDFVEGSKDPWPSLAKNRNGDCVRNGQDRTVNVALQLQDKIADKHVSVASIHWPTSTMGGHACALQNAKKTVEKVESIPGALRIWGGDANIRDLTDGEWLDWYATTNGQLNGRHNYRDAAFSACSKIVDGGQEIRQCLRRNHWTIGDSKRIDFLFAQKGGGEMPRMEAEHTVTFKEANQASEKVTGRPENPLGYSQHRAIQARIYY